MATHAKDLKIRYVGDTSGVSKSVKQIDQMHSTLGSKLKSVGSAMTSAGKTATLGLTLPLVAFGKVAIDEFGEAQRGIAQTAAVLKSTGGAANVSEKQIASLADRIGKLSAQDNDAVRQGENLLLTFTNIQNRVGKGNDIFNQATMTLADLSAAMGSDMKSSAVQLGKALNDPTKGITALTRVGVTFTDQQKKQIEALQAAGDVAGAQKIILAELNKEFGGSAKAAGDAATPTQKLALTMKDLAESVGGLLAPMLQKVADVAARVADWFNNLSPSAQKLAVTIGLIAAAVGPVLLILGKLASSVGAIAGLFSEGGILASATFFPWVAIAAAVAVLAVLIIKNWDKIKGFILPVLDAIKGAAMVVWEALKVAWTAITKAIGAAWSAIAPVAKLYVAAFVGAFKLVWTVAKEVWKAVIGAVRLAWSIVKPIAKLYIAVWSLAFKVVAAIAKVVWKAIAAVVRNVWAVISGIAKLYVAVWKVAWTVVSAIATTAWNGIKATVSTVWGWLKTVASAIRTVFTNAWNGVKSVAVNVWNAIASTIRGAINAVIGGINFLIEQLNKIQIHIPSFHIKGTPWDTPGFDWNGMNIPTITPLARGGIVRAPVLALLGEQGPEAVVPLGGRGGTGGGMDVQVTLDRRRFGRALALDVLTRGR